MQLSRFNKFFGMTIAFLLCTMFVAIQTATAADDYKPVLRVAVASLDDWMASGDIVAKSTKNGDAFQMVKTMAFFGGGFDSKQPIGFVLLGKGSETSLDQLRPVITAPLTDITNVNPMLLPFIPDMLNNPDKGKKGEFFYDLYGQQLRCSQKLGWMQVSLEGMNSDLPADSRDLLPKLEPGTLLAIQFDVQNTPRELVESLIQQVEGIAMMMGDENTSQSIGQMKTAVQQMFEVAETLSFTIGVNSKTGDMELSNISVVRKNNATAMEQMANLKTAKTKFGGFYSKDKAVVTFVGSTKLTELDVATALQSLEQSFAQAKEQMAANDDNMPQEAIEIRDAVSGGIQKMIMATIKAGNLDVAGTVFSDGKMVFAGEVKDTNTLTTMIDSIRKKIPSDVPVDAYYRSNYETFEGYKLSSITVPYTDIEGRFDIPESLEGNPVVFVFGIKSDAICGAFGMASDVDKVLKKAITASRTPIAVPQPQFFLSGQEWGNMLAICGEYNDLNLVSDMLIEAGPDANVTLSMVFVNETTVKQTVAVSPKLILALTKLYRAYYSQVPAIRHGAGVQAFDF